MQNSKGKITIQNFKFIFNLLLALLTFNFLLLTYAYRADAHVLETSGPIGAIVHIDPDDDPIAGIPSYFFFEFKDKENKFSSEKCLCEIIVLKKGQELFRQKLFENEDPSLTNISTMYTFPTIGVYTVKIKGDPIDKDGFAPFMLSYDVRVAREQKGNNNSSLENWTEKYTLPLTVGILILGFIAHRILSRQK